MRFSLLRLFILVSLFFIVPGRATGKSEVVEHLGTELDGELEFIDHHGASKPLKDILSSERPTILTFVYYRCPGACTLLLNGLGEALQDTHFELGKDFDVVTMTVDPNEGVDLAAAKRDTYVDALSLERGSKESWRFFTGSKSVITRLTTQTGFGYVYDPDTLQYIHPSVLIFVSPEGKVVRYLYGSYFQPDNFNHALVEAGNGRIGSLKERIMTSFYEFGRPDVGRRYALNVGKLAVTLLGIILLGLAVVSIGIRIRSTSKEG
ncbi:MAG: SCO family protein [Bradymonadia bacterium]